MVCTRLTAASTTDGRPTTRTNEPGRLALEHIRGSEGLTAEHEAETALERPGLARTPLGEGVELTSVRMAGCHICR